MVEKGLVPRLRFPEFRGTGGWDAFLGDALFDQITNKDHNSDLPVLAITQEQGAVPRELIDYHVSVAESSIEGYKVVEEGDFIISLRSFQGGIEYSRYRGICSPAYVILRLKPEHVPDYFRHLLKTDRFIAQMTKNLEGLRDGKMVSYKQFSELSLSTPKKGEQEKIAACLSSLDDLIAAETKTLDTLKVYKKGLMQQLFPQEGETVPRLRFPEFRGAGEWSYAPVEELVDFRSGGTPSKDDASFWGGTVPWVSAKDIKRLFLDDSEDHLSVAAIEDGAIVVPAGSILVLTRGMTLLKDLPVCVVLRPMSFNQDVKGLLPKANIQATFFAYSLLSQKKRVLGLVDIAGHGTGRLDTDKLRSFNLAIPDLAEQQRIASFLSSVDQRITAQGQKINALKTHKKGLMQGLFPATAEEV